MAQTYEKQAEAAVEAMADDKLKKAQTDLAWQAWQALSYCSLIRQQLDLNDLEAVDHSIKRFLDAGRQIAALHKVIVKKA